MKSKHLWLAFAGYALMVFLTFNALAQVGRLEGDVIKAGTNEPVVSAEIRIERTDIKRQYLVKTDREGHFLHAGVLVAGTYTIFVSAPGFAPTYLAGIKGSNTEMIKIELQSGNGSKLILADIKAGGPPTQPPPKDRMPPKIVITSPQLARGQGVKPAGSRITVTGQATDESGVREVTVRGMAARLDERGAFSAEVSLQVGNNPITVTAKDNYGNRASESFTVRRENEMVAATPAPVPVAAPVTRRYFALVIGNNRYPNLPADRQLKTAINDAQEVAKLLGADYGFETKLLTDAKRAEIIKAMNEYRRSLKPDDNLLVYYAGYGHFDNNTGKAYWLPTDAEMSNNANWIIADDVTANVRAIPARHILIVSDSCYSGMLMRAAGGRVSAPAERERYLEKMRSGAARILMASGGNESVADGGGSGYSVFARALLDGLRGMGERVFTAEELFHQYIKERVAGKSDQTPEYNPLRNSGHEAGDFEFVRRR